MVSAWTIVPGIIATLLVLFITKCWDPVAQHLGHPFDVPRRVDDLLEGIQRLLGLTADHQRDRPRPSSADVQGWMSCIQASQQAAQVIMGRRDALLTHDLGGRTEFAGLLAWLGKHLKNYRERCSVGKLADLELEKVKVLIARGEAYWKEAHAAPHGRNIRWATHPRAVSNATLRANMTLDRAVHRWGSGIRAMEHMLVRALRFVEDTTPGSFGVWGMGGVGKTTLLELVRDSGWESFDHIVFVKVGKQYDVHKVQQCIANNVGASLSSESSMQHSADTIYNHLRDKNFLLLLDDLWKRLDLQAIGIPPITGEPGRHRKVIVTSRRNTVCANMRCQENNIIAAGCLNKEDALLLFLDKVGNRAIQAHSRIPSLAKEVAAQCGGLPLVLCVVGSAMSAKEDPGLWLNAINRLKKSKVHNNLDTDEEVYQCLKYSFDNLANDGLRGCLLLCSLWAQNESIPKEQLIQWCIGLGFSEASDGFEGGEEMIHCLLDASLLEKKGSKVVEMHDVIRDMALWILEADSREQAPMRDERWSVLKQVWIEETERPMGNSNMWPICERKLARMKGIEKNWHTLSTNHAWPAKKDWPKLEMLVKRKDCLSSLPSISDFKALTFLDLGSQFRLEEFPKEICELIELEYLNIVGSGMFALPMELGKLSKLKHLHLRQAWNLRAIPRGLFSGLQNIQVVDLFCDSSERPYRPKSDAVSFSPLLLALADPEIDNLQILGICLQGQSANIEILKKMKRVRVQSLCLLNPFFCSEHQQPQAKNCNVMNLKLLGDLDSLKELAISSSDSLREVAAEWDPTQSPSKDVLLPNLNHLCLENLSTLEKVIWRNTGNHLREVYIIKCGRIKHATWVLQLKFLELLDIRGCTRLELLVDISELWPEEIASNPPRVIFPQLKSITLIHLPELSTICVLPCDFEKLARLSVSSCSKLTAISTHRPVNAARPALLTVGEDEWFARLEHNPHIRRTSRAFIAEFFEPMICHFGKSVLRFRLNKLVRHRRAELIPRSLPSKSEVLDCRMARDGGPDSLELLIRRNFKWSKEVPRISNRNKEYKKKNKHPHSWSSQCHNGKLEEFRGEDEARMRGGVLPLLDMTEEHARNSFWVSMSSKSSTSPSTIALQKRDMQTLRSKLGNEKNDVLTEALGNAEHSGQVKARHRRSRAEYDGMEVTSVQTLLTCASHGTKVPKALGKVHLPIAEETLTAIDDVEGASELFVGEPPEWQTDLRDAKIKCVQWPRKDTDFDQVLPTALAEATTIAPPQQRLPTIISFAAATRGQPPPRPRPETTKTRTVATPPHAAVATTPVAAVLSWRRPAAGSTLVVARYKTLVTTPAATLMATKHAAPASQKKKALVKMVKPNQNKTVDELNEEQLLFALQISLVATNTRKFKNGEPLVELSDEEMEKEFGPACLIFHDYYMEKSKNQANERSSSFTAKFEHKHFHHSEEDYAIPVQFEDLFELYNLGALEAGLMRLWTFAFLEVCNHQTGGTSHSAQLCHDFNVMCHQQPMGTQLCGFYACRHMQIVFNAAEAKDCEIIYNISKSKLGMHELAKIRHELVHYINTEVREEFVQVK
ncbi:Disease resistance protein RPS2 [Triticum urartu]|uniref:Disease resistance protein RPS2 n=1 Tax=Triticum urartu TaxID=4572 RepID=M7YNC7_TRIUA|nr:Disease resistance protein RPS2 [Triticum urartu]